MPRKVRVLTTSFHGPRERTLAANRELAGEFVGAAGAERADLVCLPETFTEVGLARDDRPVAEPVPGPTFDALATLAAEHAVWVVAPFSVRTEAGAVENSAVVIDRGGRLAGRYAKVHPTIGECEARAIVPGEEAAEAVVETDFGRLGLAICYDIGWPEHWARLKDAGAELVVWPSAYDGGFPLQAYAWTHGYFVVSSVQTEHAKVIAPTGRVLTATSRWHRLAAATIDLEQELFHIDDQTDKLYALQREFGRRVTVEALTEEHVFTLESNDPAWPVARLKERFGLENFRDYHARAAGVQDLHRAHATAPEQLAVGV
jgi:predicted amidohydrolase